MSKPSANDMWLAAEWLEIYEGAEDAEACRRVAAWLRKQSDAKEVRDAARKAGVPVAAVRQRLRKGD